MPKIVPENLPKLCPKAVSRSYFPKLFPKAPLQSVCPKATMLQAYSPELFSKAAPESCSPKLLPKPAPQNYVLKIQGNDNVTPISCLVCF